MAGVIPETNRLKWETSIQPFHFVTDHILVFSDHRGSERFFLRFTGTTQEFQIWLERWVDRSRRDTDWATISEAAEPRCATPSAIKLPDTPRWSEAQPR